ncbi:uncharacterized protein EDB91DRAFT_1249145 [Suillus paluster]|uniref:uncharacterized protein n=1 Tax=Suillus paluster TaxID=48578 RepID=UPI001B85DBF7|nr:uncharacterized protein EDB91DRAFT_1249145 [Suillus paluster]KAG1738620.1 hypothetical protein EDB91DRAFT_1249145 [Suillus paluster]
METQIADFEEVESEWAIDKILTHSGKRADSTFQILWKSGDMTWLSYDQVSDLSALKDYFTVLGIEDVSELEEGTGNLPAGDSQVSVGHLDLDDSAYKNPVVNSSSAVPSLSFTTNNTLLLFTCQIIEPAMAPLLTHIGAQCFTLPSGLGDGDLMVVLNMVRAYLEHDTHLRSGTAADCATPVGFGDFALAFNMMQVTNGLTSRLVEESSEGLRIGGPSPSFTELVGEKLASQPSANQPPIPEGGHWINPHHAELLEEALWMNLETTKRQREWRDCSITERRAAKRARQTASTPLEYHVGADPHPTPRTNPPKGGAGPSGTRTIPHSPRAPTPQSSTRTHASARMEIDKEEPEEQPGKSSNKVEKELTRQKKK